MIFVSGEYPPDLGGVADYTFHLAHALTQLGHEAAVVTAAGSPRTERAPDDDGAVRVHTDVRSWRLFDAASTARAIAALRPDVVNVQYVPQMYGRGGVAPGAAALPWMIRRACDANVVSTMHEIASPWARRPRRAAVALAHRVQALFITLASHHLVATNAAYAQQLRRLTSGRRIVSEVPAGASILPVPADEADVVRLRTALGEGCALVGEFSPLGVGKRPESLVALAQVLGPTARLLLLGGRRADEGRRSSFMHRACAAGVSRQITWAGALSPVDVSRHLATLDVYVHTHAAGASPRSTTLLTALAHGLPVVAFDGPETPRSFGGAIELVAAGDTDALVRRVRHLLDTSGGRARLGASARSLYEHQFRWDVIARRLVEAVS